MPLLVINGCIGIGTGFERSYHVLKRLGTTPLGRPRLIAAKIASNAPLSNYIMIQAISRIEDMPKADGLFTESLCAAITQTSPDAREGLAAFLEKRDPAWKT